MKREQIKYDRVASYGNVAIHLRAFQFEAGVVGWCDGAG